MLKAGKGRMADVHGTTPTRSASWLGASRKTAFLMASRKVEAGDLRHRLKHRSSCSTVEEDLAAATVMDGSALPAIESMLSKVANPSAGHPAQRAIAVAISASVYALPTSVMRSAPTLPRPRANFLGPQVLHLKVGSGRTPPTTVMGGACPSCSSSQSSCGDFTSQNPAKPRQDSMRKSRRGPSGVAWIRSRMMPAGPATSSSTSAKSWSSLVLSAMSIAIGATPLPRDGAVHRDSSEPSTMVTRFDPGRQPMGSTVSWRTADHWQITRPSPLQPLPAIVRKHRVVQLDQLDAVLR